MDSIFLSRMCLLVTVSLTPMVVVCLNSSLIIFSRSLSRHITRISVPGRDFFHTYRSCVDFQSTAVKESVHGKADGLRRHIIHIAGQFENGIITVSAVIFHRSCFCCFAQHCTQTVRLRKVFFPPCRIRWPKFSSEAYCRSDQRNVSAVLRR